jgi:Tfp pilus assembly protein PilO
MSKLTLREGVFLVLLFAIVLGQWQLVIVPQEKLRGQLEDDIEAKRGHVETFREIKDAAQGSIKSDIARLNRQIMEIRGRIASMDEQYDIRTGLTRQAKRNHLVVGNVSSSGTPTASSAGPPNENIKELVFSIKLQGDYMDFFTFIEAIERMDRLFTVERVVLEQMEIKKGQEREMRGHVNANMDLKFYFKG